MSLKPVLFLAAGAALAAIGCNGEPRFQDPNSPDAVISRIERRSYGPMVPPTTLIAAGPQLYDLGADIKVTVRIVAPPNMEKLDAFLPIRGRFHLREQGAVLETKPLKGAEDRAWVELIPDNRNERERTFTVAVNRIFPMRKVGWYEVWWDGEGINATLYGEPVSVRVLAAPAGR